MHALIPLPPDLPPPQVLQRCGMTSVPEVGSVEEYLARGPGFIFLYHPALGPLWDVVAQKIHGGSMCKVGCLAQQCAYWCALSPGSWCGAEPAQTGW
jgi:hypothetical protein